MIPWTCKKCGNTAVVNPGAITCYCGYVSVVEIEHAKDKIPPNILQRGINYARAWSKWVQAGRPRRTIQEVEKLRSICRDCDYFNGSICTHKRCGCLVLTPSMFGDKLAWTTETCPDGRWG